MSTTDNNNPVNSLLQSYFFQNGPSANLKLRERIALAQMIQKRAYPKTFGEGLAAIGDALGDRRMAVDLERLDKEGQTSAAGYTGPPGADGAPAPVARSYAPTDANTVAPPLAQQPIARPPIVDNNGPVPGSVPVPADALPNDAPDAPYREPTRPQIVNGRVVQPGPLQAPPPPPAPPPVQVQPQPPVQAPQPPQQPAGGFNDRFNAARPGQQSALEPPPGTPIMAAGNEPSAEERNDARNSLTQALMQRFGARPAAPGGPPPNPMQGGAGSLPAAEPAPAPVIRQAPPQDPIRSAPTEPQIQPGGVVGWVPGLPDTKPRANPVIPPSPEELALARDLSIKMQVNPYMAQSPGAIRLQQLQADRAARQKDADKVWEAQITRETEQAKQHITGRMDQAKRVQEWRKGEAELPSFAPPAPQGDQRALLGTPQSPQRTGPRIEPPIPGSIPKNWAESQQKKVEADQANLESARPELRETLDLMKKISAHPALPASVGSLGGLAKLTAPGQEFAALHEQLKGKNLAAVYQKIKGTGPVGEREGENLAKAQAALATAGTEAGYRDALKTLESTMRGAVERMERKLYLPVTAYQKTPNDPHAPDIGEIDATWSDGKTRQYIGGDPRDKENSWKIVR